MFFQVEASAGSSLQSDALLDECDIDDAQGKGDGLLSGRAGSKGVQSTDIDHLVEGLESVNLGTARSDRNGCGVHRLSQLGHSSSMRLATRAKFNSAAKVSTLSLSCSSNLLCRLVVLLHVRQVLMPT